MKSAYIPAIDGLRALAVVAVMIFHLQGSFLPGGFTGVDVFFVISGYVVARSLAAREQGNFSTYIVAFYRRRILRIFPALITCLVLTSCIVIFFIPQAWLSQSISNTGLAAFFGVSNIALAMNTDTYFSPSVEFNPFVHTWSLGVEEQFYILFPVLFYFWLQGKFRPAVLTVGLLSLAFSAWYSGNHTNLAYYLLTSRFWELAAGAMLYQYHHGRDVSGSQHEASTFAVVGLLLIAAGLVYADKAAFPLPWGLLPVLGTVALLHGILISGSATVIKPFSLRAVTYVGKLSYSLYLWHWPVYTFFRWSTGLESPVEMTSAVAITVMLGMLSYHFVERGLPKLSFIRNLSPRGIIGWGTGVITLTFVCTFLGFTGQKFLNFSNTNDRYVWYPYYSHQADVVKGDALEGRTIYVIGDSHAGAYATMLRMLADETGIKTKIYSSGGCGVSNLREPVLVDGNACRETLSGWIEELKEKATENDIIFLATLKMYRLSNQYSVSPRSHEEVLAEMTAPEAIAQREAARLETIEIINQLREVTSNILMDAPKPVFAYIPFRCNDWYTVDNPACMAAPEESRTFEETLREPMQQSLTEITRTIPDVTVWDPLPALCEDDVCPVFMNGETLYFDGDHLSGHGNRVVYPSFRVSVMNMMSTAAL